VREALQDGQKVIVRGEVTVYEARGQYQLIAQAVELQGVGALQIAFEKLKQQLAAEGLFAPERKRPLPRFPRRIGVVTSATGAALRDVWHSVQRRHPGLALILAPCRVQGEGVATEIAAAIQRLNEFSAAGGEDARLDAILVTRGGGSLEDLWAFNEEAVARAIYASALPVVSAVGHEIDFTISDFVADVRAATPTAAAEILTEDMFASREWVAGVRPLLRQRLERQLERTAAEFRGVIERLARAHPRRRLTEWWQRLDDGRDGLGRATRQQVRAHGIAWRHLMRRLVQSRPARQLPQHWELLRQRRHALREAARRGVREARTRLGAVGAQLRLLGPEHVLARGYSITADAATGAILRDAARVVPGQQLKTRLAAGAVISRVEGRE
jgi:exodeoxyribonuclease VII large subunit